MQNVESMCMRFDCAAPVSDDDVQVHHTTVPIHHDTHTHDNYTTYNTPAHAITQLGSTAARHRLGCGSVSARLRGSASDRGSAAAGWRRYTHGWCLCAGGGRRSSRAARAPKHRAAPTSAIDRRMSCRTSAAPPASVQGRANGKLSQCCSSREEPAARRSNSIGRERWCSKEQAIALLHLLVREHLQRACADVICGRA